MNAARPVFRLTFVPGTTRGLLRCNGAGLPSGLPGHISAPRGGGSVMKEAFVGIPTAMLSAALVLCGASLAHAQTRTWISGVGDDVNPCSRTAPCKTFPGAIAKTAAGGFIDVLD